MQKQLSNTFNKIKNILKPDELINVLWHSLLYQYAHTSGKKINNITWKINFALTIPLHKFCRKIILDRKIFLWIYSIFFLFLTSFSTIIKRSKGYKIEPKTEEQIQSNNKWNVITMVASICRYTPKKAINIYKNTYTSN